MVLGLEQVAPDCCADVTSEISEGRAQDTRINDDTRTEARLFGFCMT